jgi:hypothetical protein
VSSPDYVTRRELDIMKAAADVEHAEIRTRLDALDQHGSRGVLALQGQVTSLVAAVAELKTEFRVYAEHHDQDHRREARDRVTGRRWLIGTGIAGVGTMGGLIALVAQLAARVHG